MTDLVTISKQVTRGHNDSAIIEKRDTLYFGHRYRNGSYKARKAMIKPFLMTAKRDGSGEIKLYDNGYRQPTLRQEQAMSFKCKGWRQEERELKKHVKLEAKGHKLSSGLEGIFKKNK